MRSFQAWLGGIPISMGRVAALCAASTAMVGCLVDNQDTGIEMSVGASVRTPQTPLDGNAVPKFVDQLPLFSGTRSNGSETQNIRMVEFQQRVLPASVYAGRPAPFNNGTFLWGYSTNGQPASFPARTIQVNRGTATTAQYTNALTNTRLSTLLTVDQTLHWADPLGTTAANNCVNGPPLRAACTQPFVGPIPTTV